MAVLVNGCGLSETVDGGYSEYARVDSNSVVPIPDGMSAVEAMQIGTAGYTAALAIHRMEQNSQRPEGGPVVVTGATGGVGSIAIDMLDGRGYEAVAVTGKATEENYLKSIGAGRVLLRDEMDLGKRPMEKAEWAGAIDNLGGDYLTWLTRTMGYGGNIASIGLAAVHSQGRMPARYQLGGYPSRPAARSLVTHRWRPQAAPSGHDWRSHHWF